ncbi:MAG: hypothetical protein JXR76_08285 [Deltaproteobacteria bacterium]|nr:hypothetical protein [Deltaproteobacteria bacterium]
MENKNEINNGSANNTTSDNAVEVLDDLLRAYAHFDVPSDFLTDTIGRFEHAIRKKVALALGVGIGAVLLFAVTILWTIIFNFSLFSKIIDQMARLCLFTLSTILDLWHQMPEFGTGLIISLWIALFVCAALLLKAFRLATFEEPHADSPL